MTTISNPSENSRPDPLPSSTAESISTPAPVAPSVPLAKQLPIIVAIAAIVAVGGFWLNRSARSETGGDSAPAASTDALSIGEAGRQAVNIETAPLKIEGGHRTVTTNGTVHLLPESSIKVSPRVQGRVRAVLVRVGDRVTAGEPLVTLESTDAASAIGAARDADEQLKLATDALDVARKQFLIGTPEVTAAQATLDQARQNSAFQKHMLDLSREQNSIGGFSDKPLTDAQSAVAQTSTQLSQDEKDLAVAQKQYDRSAKLFSLGLAAQQDVDTAEDALGKAKDAVANDTEQVRITQKTAGREQKAFDSRLYSNQQMRQAETSYQQALLQEQAAGTALRLARAAVLKDLKQAQHDYQVAATDDHSARVTLQLYGDPGPDGLVIVRAPMSGVVTDREVNPGQMVDQSQETPWQMLTIVDASKVSVDAQAYEKDMIGMRPGERVTVTTDALPGFSAIGKVSYVAPNLDPNSHTLPVRAELDNRSGQLKDGMYVTVAVDYGASSPFPARPVVPLTAVVHDGDSDYVFVQTGDGKYARREVMLGEQRGEGNVAIDKGLTGSETIVTHGALFLDAGATSGN